MIRALEQVSELHRKPQTLRTDNGPGFSSASFGTWCKSQHIELRYIQPGNPTRNEFIERFNDTFRSEILDAYLLESLSQVQQLTEDWVKNSVRHVRTKVWATTPPPKCANLPTSIFIERDKVRGRDSLK